MEHIEPSTAVVLDASFLNAVSREGTQLDFLVSRGYELAVPETLIYELCTSRDMNRWNVAQRKLSPFSEKTQVWLPVGNILRQEVARSEPVHTPVNSASTDTFRTWLRNGTRIPQQVQTSAHASREDREALPAKALLQACDRLSRPLNELAQAIECRSLDQAKDDCYSFVNDHSMIRELVKLAHSNPKNNDLYIQDIEDRIDDSWFAFHHVKSLLALLCLYVRRYGTKAPHDSWNTLGNIRLDSHYLQLLYFGAGIASNETSGEMIHMCRWMYGDNKKFLTLDDCTNAK